MKTRFFGNCLFCHQQFVPTGVGEHVIPDSIIGFWRCYDVCPDCMEYFGDNVDGLAVKNPYILKSIEEIPPEKLSKYYDNMGFVAYDAETNEQLKVVKKGNTFRPRVERSNGYIGFPEELLGRIGKDHVKAYAAAMSEEAFELLWSKIVEEYAGLAPGEILEVPDRKRLNLCDTRKHLLRNRWSNFV